MNGVSKGALPSESTEPVRRRNRVAKSCGFCRHRKLKCDRQHPCGNCVKKNNSDCKYSSSRDHEDYDTFGGAGAAGPTPRTMDAYASTRLPVDEMQKRLDKMENLVLTLMGQQPGSQHEEEMAVHMPSSRNRSSRSPSDDTELDELGESLGLLKLDTKGKSMYHGDTYYGYLFSEISGVHDLFNQIRSEVIQVHGIRTGYGQQLASNGGLSTDVNASQDAKVANDAGTCSSLAEASVSNLPFGGIQYKLITDNILKRIPSREICEMLIDRYFSVVEPLLHIVHRPTFQIGFEEFWGNPEKTEVLWIAFFFGILTIALQSYEPDNIPPFFQNEAGAKDWWTSWVSSMELCGFVGKLTFKASLLNIRILLLWQIIESYRSDWMHRSWTSMGVLIRVAQSMGLHRDPSWFTVSVYEREERRRLWATIKYIDAMHAISQGLPLGIRSDENDVKDPLNLDDDEIMPLMESDPSFLATGHDLLTMRTDSSFSIVRNMIVQFRAEVYTKNQHIIASEKLSFAQTWEYDSKLRILFQTKIPTYFQGRPIVGLDQPDVIFQKLMLELEFLRTIVVLHRRFALGAVKNPRYASSRKEVLNASVTMLELLHWLCVGEDMKLNEVRNRFWLVGGCINSASFMHAATFVGISLMNEFESFAPQERNRYIETLQKVREILSHAEILNWDPRHNTLMSLILSKAEIMMKLGPEEREREMKDTISRQTAKNTARMIAMVPDMDEIVLDNLTNCPYQSDNTPGSTTENSGPYGPSGGSSTASTIGESSLTPPSATEKLTIPMAMSLDMGSIPMGGMSGVPGAGSLAAGMLDSSKATGGEGMVPGNPEDRVLTDDFWSNLSEEFPHIIQDMNMWQQ